MPPKKNNMENKEESKTKDTPKAMKNAVKPVPQDKKAEPTAENTSGSDEAPASEADDSDYEFSMPPVF